jgi:hypothetical protein
MSKQETPSSAPDSGRVDRAARRFNEAAAELAAAMLEQLESSDPAMTAKVAAVLNQGERMLVALEMHPAAPAIWWATIDDYQQMKRIMTINASVPTRQ